ncbi:hypothetical protein OAE87_00745 [bacterium]|nr:hypothetical protein [bacterium]
MFQLSVGGYAVPMTKTGITPEDQLRVEQTLVKPAAAGWGVKLLKLLKLEKLLKLGDKES